MTFICNMPLLGDDSNAGPIAYQLSMDSAFIYFKSVPKRGSSLQTVTASIIPMKFSDLKGARLLFPPISIIYWTLISSFLVLYNGRESIIRTPNMQISLVYILCVSSFCVISAHTFKLILFAKWNITWAGELRAEINPAIISPRTFDNKNNNLLYALFQGTK